MDHSQAIIASVVTGAPGNGKTNANANVGGNDDPSSGTRLGDFTLLKRLGRGAQGEVYEAREESLGRLVALKVLPPYLTFNPERVQRFKREAEAGGRLDHPNTVGVHSVGEASGYHYIAQELVAGGRTVADRIAEVRREAELPRDWYEKTAALFVDVAEAVHAAHEAGIVHRDIKPGNILLTHDGQPKVADFGLAMVLDDLHRSRSGEMIGTPFYMSPEQAAGGRAGLDRRTDVFSLGTTLYEALTLQRPFEGETRDQVVERILVQEPRDPRRVRPSVPRDLAVICMKGLEKRRERRYQSAQELADELRRWLRHEPIRARPPGALLRAGKWIRRHPVPTAAATGSALLLVMLLQMLRTGERANLEAAKSMAWAATTVRDIFDAQDEIREPIARPHPADPIVQRIDRLAAQAAELHGFPEEQVYLLTVAGMSYRKCSMFDEAARCLESAWGLAGSLDSGNQEVKKQRALTAQELGALRRWTGRWDEAEALLSESRALFIEIFGEASEEAYGPTRSLATALFRLGRAAEGEALLRGLVAAWAAEQLPDAPVPLHARQLLGYLLMDDRRLEAAQQELEEVYQRSRAVYTEAQHAELEAALAQACDKRAREAVAAGDAERAEPLQQRAGQLFAEAIARLRASLPDTSGCTAEALMNYGSFLSERKRYPEARAALEEAVGMALLVLGPDQRVTLLSRNNLASLAYREGKREEAEAGWREILASDRRAPSSDTTAIHAALRNLATLCLNQRRFPEALAFATELVERTPPTHADHARSNELLELIESRSAGESPAATR